MRKGLLDSVPCTGHSRAAVCAAGDARRTPRLRQRWAA
jgi:hypothetical protein